MSKSEAKRSPRSFSLEKEAKSPGAQKRTQTKKDQAKPRRPKSLPVTKEIILQSDEAVDIAYDKIDELTPPPPIPSKHKNFGWGKLALAAFGALFSIAAGIAIDDFIRTLFSRNDWLGWAATAIALTGIFALLIVILKESWAVMRLRSLEKLRAQGAIAAEDNNLSLARKVSREVVSLFASRSDTANGRTKLSEHSEDVMDAADLLHLVERDLLGPLDKRARSMVMGSAKRVSVVTAVSPRAIVDIGYVLFENMRLIRRISEHYGGRPGAISSLRLVRSVFTHLAATGAIAVGDGLLQQVIGQGLAARLSARLGEGVVNGLLTARIGIAAIDVCRPLTFDVERRPNIRDFMSELVDFKKADE